MCATAHNPPPALRTLLGVLDPADDGATVLIAPDLLAQYPSIGRDQLVECRTFLDDLLADDAIPNADLKGMLNRLAGKAWGIQFDFSADAQGARRFLEALRSALSRTIA